MKLLIALAVTLALFVTIGDAKHHRAARVSDDDSSEEKPLTHSVCLNQGQMQSGACKCLNDNFWGERCEKYLLHRCDSANHCPRSMNAMCVFADFSCNFGADDPNVKCKGYCIPLMPIDWNEGTKID